MTLPIPTRSRLNGLWLPLARGAWLLLTVMLLVVFIAGLAPRYQELVTICHEEPCLPMTLTPPDAKALAEIGLTLEVYAGYHVGMEILVAEVSGRRPTAERGTLG